MKAFSPSVKKKKNYIIGHLRLLYTQINKYTQYKDRVWSGGRSVSVAVIS